MSTIQSAIHKIGICLIVVIVVVGFAVPCRAAHPIMSQMGPTGVVSQYLHDWTVTGYASAYRDVTATVEVSSLSTVGSEVVAQALVAVTMTLREESVSDIPTIRGMLSVLGMTHYDPSVSFAAQLPASEEGLTEQQQTQARVQLGDWYDELSGYINTPFTGYLDLTLTGKLLVDGSLDGSSVQLFMADGPDLVPAEGVLPRPATEREQEGVAHMQEILQETTVADVSPSVADTYNRTYTYNHLVASAYASHYTSNAKLDGYYDPITKTSYNVIPWNRTEYPYSVNLATSGGDCIDYVSQALHAGGLPEDAVWYHYAPEWARLSRFLLYMAPVLVPSTYGWASAGALLVWVETPGDSTTASNVGMITRNDGTTHTYSCHTNDWKDRIFMGTEDNFLYYVIKGTYTMTYTAGAGGWISGTTPQFVAQGASGTPVTAVPYHGYHFVKWTLYNGTELPLESTANPRKDLNATGDITVTATFAGNTGTVSISSGGHGTVSPTSVSQTYGATGTTIKATPASGYHFVSWSATLNPTYVSIANSNSASTTITTTSLMPQSGTATITATFAEGPISSLITHYYSSILCRFPDEPGRVRWVNEITRVQSLGIDVKEGFIALARVFLTSPEYLAKGTSDAAYVTDLYETFFNRTPAPSEVTYWTGLMTAGMSRDITLNWFVYSPECTAYITSVLGSSVTRPENNLVNDLYRGFLNRLPDTVGFNAKLATMRIAQASDAAAVRSTTLAIALNFMTGPEYALRARTNAQFIEDCYNGILRRGALPAEIQGWMNLLTNGATRTQVLTGFVNSPEFQARVQHIIDAGPFIP